MENIDEMMMQRLITEEVDGTANKHQQQLILTIVR
jgi:hypothetical protein